MNEAKQVTSPDELFDKNQKLVHFVIHNRIKTISENYNGLDYEDFVQIGNIGLWKACKTYSAEKSKFDTYACMVIYNEIMTEFRKIKRNQILNNSISLYTPISDDGKCELQEVIEDPNSDVFNIAYNNYDKNLVFDSLYEQLTPIELKIFKLRMYNYKQQYKIYHSDISKILGISQRQVSRTLRKIKIKYKKWKEEKSF